MPIDRQYIQSLLGHAPYVGLYFKLTRGSEFVIDSRENGYTNLKPTLVIAMTNREPSAANDHYSTNEEHVLTVASPGVLTNDRDPDGDWLTARLVTPPAHGSLALNSNGSFTYAPATNFSGQDSFQYTANDGALSSSPATVTITVGAVNDAPVANSDSYGLSEDTSLRVPVPGILSNDWDADGDPLTVQLLSSPAHGALTWHGDGSFQYTPKAHFAGIDQFAYRVSDGILFSSVATIFLTVQNINDAPVAKDDAYSTEVGETLHVTLPVGVAADPTLLANDSDLDSDPLSAISVTNPTNGTISLNHNGTFSYTPNPGFIGADSFTYQAGDGQALSNTARGTITVTPKNALKVKFAAEQRTDGVRGQKRAISVDVTSAAPLEDSEQLSYRIDWGDGNIAENISGPSRANFHHRYTNEGTYKVTVLASHPDRPASAPVSTEIDIGIAALQPDPLNPGQVLLAIGGTVEDDTIVVDSYAASRPHAAGPWEPRPPVTINGESYGPFPFPSETALSRIAVFAQSGNDKVQITSGFITPDQPGCCVSVSSWLYGDAGNDTLQAGGAGDLLFGGDGDDLLDSWIGRNILIGGDGADQLRGSGDDDIVVTGFTSFDDDEAALFAIRKEWLAPRDNVSRRNNLSGGSSGSERFNGDYFLRQDETVFNDGDADASALSGGLDWLFFDVMEDGPTTVMDLISLPT